MLLRKLAGKLAAVTARLLPRQRSAKPKPVSHENHWPVIGRFDVLGHPVAVFRVPDGREVAFDYATYSRSANRDASPVPVDWVRIYGVPIDAPRFDGLLMSRCVGTRAPMVTLGPDGTVVIVTSKGALTRKKRAPGGARWLRGVHVGPEVLRRMQRVVGERARAFIADSQSPTAFMSRAQEFGDQWALALTQGGDERKHNASACYDAESLREFSQDGYSEAEIAASRRAAAELIDRIAAPTLTDIVTPGVTRPNSPGPSPRP